MAFLHFPPLFFPLLVVALFSSSPLANARPNSPPSFGKNINKDALNAYGDYGIEFNGFSIDKDGKITYPALFDSLKYAEEKRLDPCEDFYEFVCRGVKNKVDAAKEKNETVEEEEDKLGRASTVHNVMVVGQIEQFWLDHFTKEELRKDFSLDEKISRNMFTFYNKCVEHGKEEEEFATVLANQFRLSQFAETNGSTPTAPPVVVHEFNTAWIERTHPFNPFFTLDRIATKEIGPAGQMVESEEFRIELTSAIFSAEYVLEYQQWLNEEGRNFTAKMRAATPQDGEMVQQKLLEIADAIGLMGQTVDNDTELVGKMALGEFQRQFGLNGGRFNWLELLRKLFPNAKVSESSVMLVYYMESFKKFMAIVQKYGDSKSAIDKAAFSEYLLWNLINTVRAYNYDEFSPLLCIRRMAFPFFAHPLSQLLYKKMGIDGKGDGGGTLSAMDVYKFTRRAFEKILKESSWQGQKRAKYATDKLAHIFTTIGMDSEVGQEGTEQIINKEVYAKYDVDEGMNWLEMLVQIRRVWLRNYPQRHHEYTDMSSYYAFRKEISIGAVNRLLPAFHAKFPAQFNFGYFAKLMGHEQAHALQLDNSDMDGLEAGVGREFWDKNYTNEYQRRGACFAEQYEREFKKLYPNLTHADTLSEDLADNIGTQIGFEAWRLFQRANNAAGGNGTGVGGKTTFAAPLGKYSPEQTLFIGSTFPWCFTDRDDPVRNDFPKGYDIHSVARMRANIPLMNFPQFAKEFRCKPKQAMNPEKRCQFY